MEMITRLSSPSQPLATHQAEANAQHYEVPTAFLELCLGPRMKYSSCVYPSLILPDGRARSISAAKESLGEAEVAMLETYTVKAGLGPRKDQLEKEGKDGQKAGEGLKLLDLGCGWGSLGLYLAEVRHFTFSFFPLVFGALTLTFFALHHYQQYPAASIKMLSNSRTQKVHIDGVCQRKGFGNVEVITGDFTQFDFEEKEQ